MENGELARFVMEMEKTSQKKEKHSVKDIIKNAACGKVKKMIKEARKNK